MEEKEKYILVTEGKTKHLLPVEDILHIQAVRVYSIFYVRALSPEPVEGANGARQLVSSQNIGKVLSKLDPTQFLRIHKSHIVNLHEVRAYQNARGGKVILSNNQVIEVAQRRKTELLQHLAQLNKKAESLKLKKLSSAQIIAQTKKR